VRHDLPHMPSLGVSSLDSGRHGNMAASFFSRTSLERQCEAYSAAKRAPPNA